MRALSLCVVVAAIWPSLASADPALPPICTAKGDVDRLDDVLECPKSEGGERSAETSVRRKDGWHRINGGDDTRFTADETAHVDAWLAIGLAHVCSGETSTEMQYVSLHSKEYGYPLDICHGQRFLAIHRGKATLELRDSPLVDELAALAKLLRLHGLGRTASWTK